MTDDTSRNVDQGQPGRPEVKKAFQNLPVIWIVPIVALIIGGWLLWREASAKGPEITVTFESAEGLTAGKTAVRYRDVDPHRVFPACKPSFQAPISKLCPISRARKRASLPDRKNRNMCPMVRMEHALS